MSTAKKGQGEPGAGPAPGGTMDVKFIGSPAQQNPRWRKFAGPRGSGDKRRVVFTRHAYADLVAHAKESLDAEICGILIGEWCEDEEGSFIAVDNTIRGTQAREGSTHVTFTQETWNQIHSQKDSLYPKLQIIGWYHSHPGFGVEFSEMDLFIQQNFFGGPSQLAFVIDPLGGEEAVMVNEAGGVKHLDRFWVDGRERRCRSPAPADPAESSPTTGGAAPVALEKSLRALEDRVSQLMLSVEAQHVLMYRILVGIGMIVAAAVILFILNAVWASLTQKYQDPKLLTWTPMPIPVGDKMIRLGVGLYSAEVPKELIDAFVDQEIARRNEAMKAASTTNPATQPEQAASAAPSTAPSNTQKAGPP